MKSVTGVKRGYSRLPGSLCSWDTGGEDGAVATFQEGTKGRDSPGSEAEDPGTSPKDVCNGLHLIQ